MNFLKNTKIFLPILYIILTACEPKVRTWELFSPDEKLSIILTHTRLVDEHKTELSYQVFLKTDSEEIEIIKPSKLGITRLDAAFTDQLSFHSKSKKKKFSNTYELLAGKKS